MSDETLKATPAPPAPPADQAPKPFPVRMAEARKAKREAAPPPADGAPPTKRTYTKSGNFRGVHARRSKGKDIAPNPAAPKPTPRPKPPKKPSPKHMVTAIKWRHISVNACSLQLPVLRVSTMLREIGEMTEYHTEEAFWDGQLSAVGETWSTWSRITQYGTELRAFLLAHRGHWKAASLHGAQRILEQLPDHLEVYRGCAARNKVGFTWCSSEAAAKVYPHMPAFREREPLLVTAVIPKARVVSLRETHHGFEVLALAEPGDVVSETPIK
jgi:hypothetical protein